MSPTSYQAAPPRAQIIHDLLLSFNFSPTIKCLARLHVLDNTRVAYRCESRHRKSPTSICIFTCMLRILSPILLHTGIRCPLSARKFGQRVCLVSTCSNLKRSRFMPDGIVSSG
jgi:hypothetical protein